MPKKKAGGRLFQLPPPACRRREHGIPLTPDGSLADVAQLVLETSIADDPDLLKRYKQALRESDKRIEKGVHTLRASAKARSMRLVSRRGAPVSPRE